MNLLLIRHAHPDRVERTGAAPADPPLSATGQGQARRLASFLSGERLDAVWSSPLRRAVETAAPLADLAGVELVVDDGLAEFDRDASSYVPFEEWAPGDERSRALADGRLCELFGVDPDTFRRQAVTTMERIVGRHRGQAVAAVTHGGIINAYLGHVLGLDDPFFFRPHYTGISRVAAGGGIRTVVSINEAGHLRDLVIPDPARPASASASTSAEAPA